MGFTLTILCIITLIVLAFMGFIPIITACILIVAFIVGGVLDRLIISMRARTKIIFIFIPIVVLGFTGILPANVAWVSGVVIILNCLLNRNVPMKPLEYLMLFIAALIVLFFMNVISLNTAFLFLAALIGMAVLYFLMRFMKTTTKIVFILIPIVILGFTGILHANLAWLFGVMTILNCIFNRFVPMKSLNDFKDITPEQILKDGGISDPTRQKLLGQTPLHTLASSNENPEAIKALLNTGADIGARSGDRSTPLFYASRSNKNPEVIRVLLNAGADVKARDIFGNTPLHEAAEYNKNPEIIQVLLDAGAEINEQNHPWPQKDLRKVYIRNPREHGKIGNTPLHNAARWNENPEIIIALLNAGADGKIKNYAGKNPAELIKNEHFDVLPDYFKTPKNKALEDTDAYQALKDASE